MIFYHLVFLISLVSINLGVALKQEHAGVKSSLHRDWQARGRLHHIYLFRPQLAVTCTAWNIWTSSEPANQIFTPQQPNSASANQKSPFAQLTETERTWQTWWRWWRWWRLSSLQADLFFFFFFFGFPAEARSGVNHHPQLRVWWSHI